uniref:lipocalin-15 isoform X3 n=1 Tax=Halichoerus grypus TaxID=9711 RepID=UPI001659DE02|nr:lipocalin-15 isoform X3 [Halichoerus grypus]
MGWRGLSFYLGPPPSPSPAPPLLPSTFCPSLEPRSRGQCGWGSVSGPCTLLHGCVAPSPAALGYLDVRIVDTDYSSFAVVYVHKELEGALSTMVQLYTPPLRTCLPTSITPNFKPRRTRQGWQDPPALRMGRTQEASPQAVKIFRDFYPTVGLPDDMMVMLPKSDMCSSGDKEAP